MRAIPIPVDAVWTGARRMVLAAPNNDLEHPTVAAVESVVDLVELEPGLMHHRFSMLIKLEAGDTALLEANGGHFWLSIIGGFLQPFDVSIDRPGGD